MKIDVKDFPQDPTTTQRLLDHIREDNKMEKELGHLGKFFGSGNSIKMNIAGSTIFICLAVGLIVTIVELLFNTNQNSNVISIKDMWSIIMPPVTLALGYMFGKNSR